VLDVTMAAPVIAKKERGINVQTGEDVKAIPCHLLHIDTNGTGAADATIVYRGAGGAEAIMPKAEVIGQEALAPEDLPSLVGQRVEVAPRATAFTRAVVEKGRTPDGDAIWAFNPDSVIPTFLTAAMPGWFGLLFLLTLLAAGMSTLSSQFHAVGTSIGRDVFERATNRSGESIGVTRLGVIIGIVVAVIIAHYARGGYIVARATAIFFGLCGSAFLPAFVGGLFFKGVSRAGAKWSMVTGFAITAFWLLFVKDKEARALGVCQALTGKHSLFESFADGSGEITSSWYVVDPIVVALPASLLVLIVVSALTKKPDAATLEQAFGQ
jgi:SSS family solute:Na+ symporter